MRVAFVASFAPIVPDPSASGSFYSEALGLSLDGAEGAYRFTEQLDGVKHFGLWPLAEAAQACFGTAEWPSDVSRPQASIEFEVESVEAVAAAASELAGTGLRLLHAARTEPWGQTVTRLLSPEGLVVGVCYTPQFHGDGHDGG